MDGPPPSSLNRHLLRQGVRPTPVIALAIVAFDSRSAAPAGDKRRGEKEIRATIAGRDTTDGAHWSMYLHPDGALVGAEAGTRWTGAWNVQKSKRCMSNPGSKAFDCCDVWISGDNISLRLKPDDDTFFGIVEKHKTN